MTDRLFDFDEEGDLVDFDELELPDDDVISSWEDMEEDMKRRNFDGMDYVEDFTGGKPEYTDAEGRAWITPDTLAQRFRDLCEATGMTCGALATYCGVSAHTMSNYRSGETCCPRSVWQLVKSRKL